MTIENSDNLFNVDPNLLGMSAENSPTDDDVNPFEALVGEGRKYKTPEELAKSVAHKDEFIEQLKRELKETRELAAKNRTIEDLMEAVNKSRPNRSNNDDNDYDESGVNRNSENEQVNQKPVNTDEIVASVVKALETKNTLEQQKRNLLAVQSALVKKYGQSYVSELNRLGEDRGLTPDILDKLAKDSPERFFKAIGISTSEATSNPNLFVPPAGQTRSVEGANKTGERNNKFYQNLKAKNPGAYWSAATQLQLHRDAVALGDRFFM